jgi:ATP-dependent DNA ligase
MAYIRTCMKGPNTIFPFNHPFIKYPQYASVKMDGERMINLCGEAMISPSLKLMRNKNLRNHAVEFFDFCKSARLVTDCEIWSPIRSFHMPNKEEGISSILSSYDREIPDDIGFYVFDLMSEDEWDKSNEPIFSERYNRYWKALQGFKHVFPIVQFQVGTAEEAECFYNDQILSNQEGIILRSPRAKYKHGRCTDHQDGMWKFKEFLTVDATIVRIEEGDRLKDGMERTTNMIGRLERRYDAAAYEPAGKVGAFVVRNGDGTEFKVKPGKGYNDAEKTCIWEDYVRFPEKWHGKHVEYKYMSHGTLDKPRIGSLVRFRPDKD